MTGTLHGDVAIALLHAALHYRLKLRRRQLFTVGGIGSAFHALFLAEETRLKGLAQMLHHGILGIFLHTGVNRSVYLQSVGIDVIFSPVGFRIFLNPSK